MLKADQFGINKLYFDGTYAGLMLGIPNSDMNKDIIDNTMKLFNTLFYGNGKFIEPVIEKPEADTPWYERLPCYRIMGTVVSEYGITRYGDYRLLNFIGFVDNIEDIKTSINNLLKDVDWEQDSFYVDIDNM